MYSLLKIFPLRTHTHTHTLPSSYYVNPSLFHNDFEVEAWGRRVGAGGRGRASVKEWYGRGGCMGERREGLGM